MMRKERTVRGAGAKAEEKEKNLFFLSQHSPGQDGCDSG
jgi:hypothetical protein